MPKDSYCCDAAIRPHLAEPSIFAARADIVRMIRRLGDRWQVTAGGKSGLHVGKAADNVRPEESEG